MVIESSCMHVPYRSSSIEPKYPKPDTLKPLNARRFAAVEFRGLERELRVLGCFRG